MMRVGEYEIEGRETLLIVADDLHNDTGRGWSWHTEGAMLTGKEDIVEGKNSAILWLR
jgi:hypothetical protein